VPAAAPDKDRTALVVAICIVVIMLLAALGALAIAYLTRSDTVTAWASGARCADATKGPAGG